MSDKLELIPVEDIKVTKGMTVDQMLKAMGRAGGFTAQKLADATDIAEAMVKKEGCLRILSFPACIMATGTRGVIVDMVKNDMVDLIGDEQMLSEMTNEAEYTGAIIIGGGISKHHVIWWNQFRGGLDYCIYLTTAEEYDGSLSGARIREAVSWGKVKEDAKKMTVEGDATITLPLIYAGLAERLL